MAVVQRLVADRAIEEDLSPSQRLQGTHRPDTARGRARGGHHRILHPPARANEFRAVMQESRRGRLRQGALDWQLMHDISNPTLRGAHRRRVVVVDGTPAPLRPRDRLRRRPARAQAGLPTGDAPSCKVTRWTVER